MDYDDSIYVPDIPPDTERMLDLARREIRAFNQNDIAIVRLGRQPDGTYVLTASQGVLARGRSLAELWETWSIVPFRLWKVDSLEELDLKLSTMGY